MSHSHDHTDIQAKWHGHTSTLTVYKVTRSHQYTDGIQSDTVIIVHWRYTKWHGHNSTLTVFRQSDTVIIVHWRYTKGHDHNSTLTVGMVRVGSVGVGRMNTDPFSHTSYGLSARFPDVMSATVGAPVYQTAQNRSLFCIFHQSQNSLRLHLNAAILPTSFQWISWEQCAERSSENTSQTNTTL